MSGFFASALLMANEITMLYQNTSAAPITVNIRAANQNDTAIQYWVAIGFGAVPEDKNCITPNIPLGGNEPWEDTGQRLGPNEKVWARASKNNVSVRVFGVED